MDIAGNAFNGACVAALLSAVITCVDLPVAVALSNKIVERSFSALADDASVPSEPGTEESEEEEPCSVSDELEPDTGPGSDFD